MKSKTSFYSTIRSRGYTLIEAMIVAAAMAAGIAAIYAVYQKVFATKTAYEESQNAAELTNRIMKAYGPMANFTGISTAAIINEGVVPSTMTVSNGTISTGFGGDITVTPATIDDVAGAGFMISFTDVPQKDCARLVTSTNQLNRYHEITVASPGGSQQDGSVITVGNNGAVNQDTLASACGQSPRSNIDFTYRRQQTSSSASSLDLCIPPAPETRVLECPAGYGGEITETRTGFCDGNYGLPVWNSWVVQSNTCQLICAPDPTSPETRNVACPTGYLGGIVEKRLSTCANQYATPQWGAWTVASDTCAPACVVDAPEQRTVSCPSGYLGDKKERRISTCPAPTGSPVWGAWTVYQDNCLTACVVPTPSTTTRWLPATRACPTGYSGNVSYEYEQSQTASCPQTTGSPVWSTWASTGHERNEDNSQCLSVCHPETTLTQWVPASKSCATGYSGTINYEKEQTRTSICTPGALSPTTSAWADTGQTRNEVDSCIANPCAVPSSKSWTASGSSCSASTSVTSLASGDTVTFTDSSAPVTGSSTYKCVAGVLNATPTSSTCGTSHCTVASGTDFTWANGGATCNFTPSSTSYVAIGSSFNASDAGAPTTGSATFACTTGGVLATTASSGSTCNGACGPAPNPDTRTINGCASGQYGSWSQSNPYESAAYPTCWSQTTDTWSPATAPAGACASCPALATTTETQWVTRNLGCPSGYLGTHTLEYQQSRSKTVSYSCPAGTATLPAPSTAYTTWADTGLTQNDYNTCAAACVAPPATTETTTQTEYRTISCGTFQTGVVNQYRNNTAQRSVTYSCPQSTGAYTTTYGNWNVVAYGAWTTSTSSCALPACDGTLEGNARNYMSRYVDLYNAFGTNYAAAYQHWYQSGYYEGRTSCWPATCTLPSPSTQTQYNTQRVYYNPNDCAAGNYGYNQYYADQKQDSTRSAYCPQPTGSYAWGAWSAYGAWYYTTGWTYYATQCAACPGPTTESNYQWVTVNNGCPAGYTGSNTYEAQQVQTRTKSYSCPAGTATLPAPSYSGWSGWSNTGATRNAVNTCTAPSNPCGASVVDWSGTEYCSQSIGAAAHGTTRTVSVSNKMISGYAEFICNNGTWQYVWGDCGCGWGNPSC